MKSLYLCSPPSFLSGMARIFDFGSTFDQYNEAPTGEQADAIGILWDWSMVGQDLWNSVNTFRETSLRSTEPPKASV
jgi:hypothetical protein